MRVPKVAHLKQENDANPDDAKFNRPTTLQK